MKVSLFVHNLSANPIVRAYPIAKAIQSLGHEVEILGLTYYTDKVYEPYRNEFEYKTIKSYDDIRWVIINGMKLAKMATGDVVYAFKPVWGTFFPALLYSGFGLKRRLILDAEDNELWDCMIQNGWKTFLKKPYYPVNPIYNKLLHPFTFLVKRKTVVCTSLQKRYGGIIVLHGPKALQDEGNLPSHKELRTKYNLPLDKKLVLFAGTAVYYNGVDFLIKAMQLSRTEHWHLVLVGNKDNSIFQRAKVALKDRCHLLGFVPNACMPEVLKLADLTPVIQTPIPSTEMQIPAKLLEAMSMGKGIVATPVADLPLLLSEDRGWIIQHDKPEDFATLLHYLNENPDEIKRKGEKAKAFFENNASVEVIAEKIEALLS